MIRKVSFALTPAALLLAVFCLGFLGEPENDPWLNASPLWGPGDPFYARDPAHAHHLAHPLLIWRGRPRYEAEEVYESAGIVNPIRTNSFGFRDEEVADPKPGGVRRVLNVGDSATWGLNLPGPEQSYPAQLRARLAEDGGWDVVNAGVVGHSSLQALQLLRLWMDALDPDVVSVYVGNNDPARALLPDAARVAAGGALQAALQRNRFYLLLQKAFLHVRAGRLESEREALEARRKATVPRVAPDAYETNLREMVAAILAAGARPILLKVPMNLVWPPQVRPWAEVQLGRDDWWGTTKTAVHYLRRIREGEPTCRIGLLGHPYLCRIDARDLVLAGASSIAELDRRAASEALSPRGRLRAAHNAAVRTFVEGDAEDAAQRLADLAAKADACGCLRPGARARIAYNRGIAELVRSRREEAFAALLRARTIEPFAMSPVYEERFDRVVSELGVDAIDLPALFAAADPLFRGSALLHDWVHPDPDGNRIVAEALERELARPER